MMETDLYEKDEYSPHNYSVNYPRAVKLNHRIEKVLNMNVAGQYSATPYQMTNYGLGGMVEDHTDPYGYNEGRISQNLAEVCKLHFNHNKWGGGDCS